MRCMHAMAIVAAFLGYALLGMGGDETTRKDEYLVLVKRITPYELFRLNADILGVSSELFSPKTYEAYSEVLATEYMKSFTLQEMEEIARFHESAVGRKWVRFRGTNRAWDKWWLQMHPVAFWSCAMHPQVRASKEGKCPICEMELVPQREIDRRWIPNVEPEATP